MTIDPDGLTIVSGFLAGAGLLLAGWAIVMKRKSDALKREIDLGRFKSAADQF